MGSILDEFRNRRSLLANMNYEESKSRISGFLDWLDSNAITKAIISEVENDIKVNEILKKSDHKRPPAVSNPEDVVQIGLYFMRQVKLGKEVWSFSHTYGILPSFNTNSVQYLHDEVIDRYIEPAIEYIQDKLFERTQETDNMTEFGKPIFNILSGDFRGSIINIDSTLTRSSQIIENIPDVDENAKGELVKLIEELKGVLSKTPPEEAQSAEATAWAAEELIKATTSHKTNRVRVEITKDNLIKAASNLVKVMPIVLPIVERIIALIEKLK